MDTHFNFNSAICTSSEQSERLLKLGLKKETADCCYIWRWESDSHFLYANSWKDIHSSKSDIPAWSLHRLIEMTPNKVVTPTKGHYYRVQYYNRIAYEFGDYSIAKFFGENLYDNIIDCIEWLIKEGYFNKEYLV